MMTDVSIQAIQNENNDLFQLIVFDGELTLLCNSAICVRRLKLREPSAYDDNWEVTDDGGLEQKRLGKSFCCYMCGVEIRIFDNEG